MAGGCRPSYPVPMHLPPTGLIAIALALILPAARAEKCLVIGDSLTKEYEVWFPPYYTQNPAAWNARNWIEILHQHRTDWFDTGPLQFWVGVGVVVDPRALGHKHNWAFPGATIADIRERVHLTGIFDPDQFWVDELEDQIETEVDRVVIFAGGNDVDAIYPLIYEGADPAPLIQPIVNNLIWMVDWVRARAPLRHLVLVGVPHVGITPNIQSAHPTDPVKTPRVTAAFTALNDQLQAAAATRGIGFCREVFDLTVRMIYEPVCIGGVDLIYESDPDARPRYVFTGDDFHPNTGPHVKIAQAIIDTFNAAYPSKPITPLSDSEALANVLGLADDLPFTDFLDTFLIDPSKRGLLDDAEDDGHENLIEFAIDGFDPTVSDGSPFTSVTETTIDNVSWLAFTYRPRPQPCGWCTVTPKISTNLSVWNDVPAAQWIDNADGTFTVLLPKSSGPVFLRLHVDR